MLEVLAGIAVVVLALADVFVTVLYARVYSGFFVMRATKVTAAVFRRIAPWFGRKQAVVMSLLGPVIMVQTVALWFAGLTLGMALIIHPALGTDVVLQGGDTPTDFVTALFAGGTSISVVSAGSFVPQTTAYRIAYLVASIAGFSVLSLVVTYLLQIYSSLHRRNALGAKFEMLTANKGDAAELIARLGPRGKFDTSPSTTAELAGEMSAVKEAHHFYPILVYFRFSEPFYAVSRFTLVALDAYSLLSSAVDEEEHGWVAESANMLHLWEASRHMADVLADTFAPGREPARHRQPSRDDVARWRARWDRAVTRLRAAGIRTPDDEEAGFERYAELRHRWDDPTRALAETLGFSWDQIDVAGSKAAAAVIQPEPWRSRGGSSSPSFFY